MHKAIDIRTIQKYKSLAKELINCDNLNVKKKD